MWLIALLEGASNLSLLIAEYQMKIHASCLKWVFTLETFFFVQFYWEEFIF